MKVAFVLIVFQSDHVLEPCLRSVLPYGNVVAAEGPVRFWQWRGYKTSTDHTNAILDKFSIPTVHGQWQEKDDEQNAALSLVSDDADFVWCLDADEIWKAQDIESVMRLLQTGAVDSVSFNMTSFYGGFDRYMTGFEEKFEVHRIQRYYPGARFETHRPPTINAPDGKPWRLHRHAFIEPERFYHYSYVFPSQMKAKAQYYDAMGGNIPNYYDAVYLPWVRGNDMVKCAIEDRYDGVHNWIPKRRGPCRTARFEGEHPAEIQAVMPELRARLDEELAQ